MSYDHDSRDGDTRRPEPSIFEFKPAIREGTPPLIGIWGPSNSGKTLTALLIARGLVGPRGRIGFVDTENKRAKFYAADVGGWEHLDFQPAFTPDRYSAAFRASQEIGQDVTIVDSMSHVWEGEGGVLDMADSGRSQSGAPLSGLKKWQAPKMAYKRMMNSLLRSPKPVIFCLRTKEGVKQVGKGSSAEIENIGAQPICGKGFIYEMTVSVLLGFDHCPVFPDSPMKVDPLIPALKAPRDLFDKIFFPGRMLGIETGERIAEWVHGAPQPFDAVQAELERVARDVSTMGSAALERHWKSIGAPGQHALKHIKEELKSIAAEADHLAAAHEGAVADGDSTEGLAL